MTANDFGVKEVLREAKDLDGAKRNLLHRVIRRE